MIIGLALIESLALYVFVIAAILALRAAGQVTSNGVPEPSGTPVGPAGRRLGEVRRTRSR
jgi:hypothetical protein